jgi:hypothetical protein
LGRRGVGEHSTSDSGQQSGSQTDRFSNRIDLDGKSIDVCLDLREEPVLQGTADGEDFLKGWETATSSMASATARASKASPSKTA